MTLTRSKKIIITITLFLTSTISSYCYVVYGHHYGNESLQILFFILASSFPIGLQLMYYKLNPEKKWSKLYYGLLGGAIIIVTITALSLIEQGYMDHHLKNYGTKVNGVITSYYSETRRSGTSHYAVFTYNVNGTSYTQKTFNDKLMYKTGDSLLLKTSTKDPEIFEIIEENN